MVAKTLPYSNYWHMKNYIRDEDVARDSTSPCRPRWNAA